MRTIWRLSAVNANIKCCVLDHSMVLALSMCMLCKQFAKSQ